MKNKIVVTIKVLIYGSFFVPLLFPLTGFIFPFIVPKILLFRTIVMLMLGLYGLLLIINWDEYRPRLNLVSGGVLAFIISFAISTFVGVDPYHSFWDNHERMLGLFTILHYGLYFYIIGSVLKTTADWQKAFKVFLIAGSLVMFIGVLQKINPNLLLNQGSPRVASTLGNPIYVGGFGLFLFFVAALLFVQEKIRAWKCAEIVLGLLGILGIFLSGTRGTLLGLGVGVVVGVVWYALALKTHSGVRKGIVGVLAALIILGGITWVFRTSPVVQSIPGVNRVVDTSLSDVINGPRFIAWHIAWESFLTHPLFGWGPNNFFYAFNAHYNPRSYEFGATETWFDNAHNILMNTLAVQGIVGLITYLVLFILTIVALYRAYRRQHISIHILIIGSTFVISHFVHNLTVFEDPTSYLYFMAWLGFIYSCVVVRKNDGEGSKDRRLNFLPSTVVGIVALILVIIFEIQPARANQRALLALQMIGFDPAQGLIASQSALGFKSPHIDDIRSDISRTIINADRSKWSADQVSSLDHLAEEGLKANVVLHPLDIRNHLMLAQYYQNQPGAAQNKVLLSEAKNYLQQALILSPRRQQIIYNLAIVDLQLGNTTEGIQVLEQALKDDSNISENYWRLAYVYAVNNQVGKAQDILKQATQKGLTFSDDAQQIVNQIMNTSSTASSALH